MFGGDYYVVFGVVVDWGECNVWVDQYVDEVVGVVLIQCLVGFQVILFDGSG